MEFVCRKCDLVTWYWNVGWIKSLITGPDNIMISPHPTPGCATGGKYRSRLGPSSSNYSYWLTLHSILNMEHFKSTSCKQGSEETAHRSLTVVEEYVVFLYLVIWTSRRDLLHWNKRTIPDLNRMSPINYKFYKTVICRLWTCEHHELFIFEWKPCQDVN